MSIKFELQRSVMGVLLDTIGLKQMTEEDFAFVEMAGEYGSRRDKDNSDFHEGEAAHIVKTEVAEVMQQAQPDPAPYPTQTPGTTGAAEVPQAREVDRAPEPASVEEVLDTSAPAPSPNDPPPDYETLTTKG